MRILISAQETASSVISKLAGSGGLGMLAAAAIGVTAAVGVSVKKAGDFQSAVLQLQGHAGLAANQVGRVSQALLAMGPAVGQGPTQLAQAMYPVLSGLSSMTDQAAKSKVALVELNNAAKSVAGTSTNVNDVTFAMTSTYNAYGLATNNVALASHRLNMISDVMNATVSEGNMRWADYSRMVGNFMAKASQAHIGITEANAALAVFTNSGESAQLAGTHLGALFLSMSANADTYAKRAAKMHESFDVAKFKSLDLADKIKYLDKITGDDPGRVKAILGNQTLSVTFMKLHNHMGDYQHALNDLNHSQGATNAAFGVASGGFNFSLQRLSAALDSLEISIGTIFLPVLTSLVNAIVPIVANMATWVAMNAHLGSELVNKVTPAFRDVVLVVEWLSSRFEAEMGPATQFLTARMYSLQLGMTGHNGVLDAFQQTGQWITGTGTPVYTSFAHVVGDVLGGSYEKLGRDAANALGASSKFGQHIGQTISLSISASLKTIKIPAIKMPSMGGMPGGGMFASLLGPLQQIGGFFKGLFQPFIDEWNRVSAALMPSFTQFGQWWQQTMGPLFAQLIGGAKQAHSPLKELLDIFGNVVIFVAKFGMIFIEHVLPAFVTGVGVILTLLQPLLDFWLNLTGWLSTTGIDIIASFFNNIGPLIGGFLGKLGEIKDTIGNVLGWIGSHISSAVSTWQSFFSGFGQFVSGIWNGLSSGLTNVLNFIITQINSVISGIDSIHVNIAGHDIGFNIPQIPLIMNGSSSTGIGAKLPGFASGIENFSGGLAYVHQRELLVNMPAGTSVKKAGSYALGGGGRSGGHSIHFASGAIVINSQATMTSQLVDELENEIARRFFAQAGGYSSGGVY